MIAQVTSAALVAESRVLSHPASVDSIPSSAGREDHVSMGMTAALKARQISEFTRSCLAIELLVAAQALDYRQPVKAGRGAQAAYELIRGRVPTMEKDREVHLDIEKVSQLIDSGELLAAVRAATQRKRKPGTSEEADLKRLRKSVEKATAGLLFMSESDARVLFVANPEANISQVTPEAVVRYLAAQHDGRTELFAPNNAPLAPLAGRPVEVRDAKEFFSRRIENVDPADPSSQEYARKLRELQLALEKHLQEVRVIRFGEPGRTDVSGAISVFIVGRTEDGDLAGVLTGAVET
jgi:hypothetical protein